MNKRRGQSKGFTLIEILVVIGLIAILAAIVLIAINPARQFAQARNSQRESNVETILNALGQYYADNKGVAYCSGITDTSKQIGKASGNVDLETCLVPKYIAAGIPTDPSTGTSDNTGYWVVSSSTTGRIEVCAPGYTETALGRPAEYCLSR